ncbi:MAG: hypothetical protein K6D97_00050 [Clostridia bacterium]|nr:hypothetical protein [Clostridia bacterium]
MKKRSAASELSASEKVILGVKDTDKVFWSASFRRYFFRPFIVVAFLLLPLLNTMELFDESSPFMVFNYFARIIVIFAISFFVYACNRYRIFFENNEIVIRGTLNGKENRLKIDDNPRMYIEKKEKFTGRSLIIDHFFHIFTKDEEVELNMDSFGEEYFNDFINNFIYKDINEIDNETLDKISLEHEYNYAHNLQNAAIKVSGIKNPNNSLVIKVRPTLILWIAFVFCLIFGSVWLYFTSILLILGDTNIIPLIIFSLGLEVMFVFLYRYYSGACYIKVKYGANYLTINGKKFYVGNESPTGSDVYFYIYPAGTDIVTFLLSFEQSSHVGSSKMEYMLLAEYEGKHKIVIRNVPDNKAILRLFEECDYTIIESEDDLW